MKNSLTRKITAAAAALLVALSLAGCSMYAEETPEDAAVDTTSAADVDTTSAADVSGTDVSGSDVVSGADVSGSDVVVDDATLADNALNAYFTALNTGDAAKLVELTAAPPMVDFLTAIGTDTGYLLNSFQQTIDSMKSVSGGYNIAYEYTVAEATEDEMADIKAEVEAMSAGAGEKVQAARTYNVTMKAYSAEMNILSNSDVVSAADDLGLSEVVSAADAALSGELLEETQSVMYLYKYNGQWYVM